MTEGAGMNKRPYEEARLSRVFYGPVQALLKFLGRPLGTPRYSTKISEESEVVPVLKLALDALITEYNAMHESTRLHDQALSSLANFMILIFSASVAGLSVVISQQQYLLLLPIFSLPLSIIGLSYRRRAWLIDTHASYESEVLRPKLYTLLRKASHPEEIPEGANNLWEWQHYLVQQARHGSKIHRIARKFAYADIGHLSVIGSVGYVLLFLYYRGIFGLSLLEIVLLLVAGIYSAWLLLVYTRSTIGYLKPLVEDQSSPSKAIHG
jgi:hypothetical protein